MAPGTPEAFRSRLHGWGGLAALLALAWLMACAPGAELPAGIHAAAAVPGECAGCPTPLSNRPPRPVSARPPLKVTFLGVGGFLIEHGDAAVLTPPLYTRPDMVTALGGEASSDAALVAANLASAPLWKVRAVLVGHAHYDHLLDLPAAQALAPQPVILGNRTMAHTLAALAPDRATRCSGGAPAPALPRERVIALDEPSRSAVDYRPMPSARPAGASLEGAWVAVPQAAIRVRALASAHPDQFLGVHYAEGSLDADLCELPRRPADWKEGATLAFLVDFLDAAGQVVFRVYYQDAPTDAPVGHVPAVVLSEKRIDLALLCVGTYQKLANEPTALLQAMLPRFAVGGHWEDFFVAASAPARPQPFLDTTRWLDRARAALPDSAGGIVVDGAETTSRAWLPQPGATFELQPP